MFAFLLCNGSPSRAEVSITGIDISKSGIYENVTIRTTGWITPRQRFIPDGQTLLLSFEGATLPAPIALVPSSESMIGEIGALSYSGKFPVVEIRVVFRKSVDFDVINLMGRNMTLVECWPQTEIHRPVWTSRPPEGPRPAVTGATPSVEAPAAGVPSGIPGLKGITGLKIVLNGSDFSAGGKPVFSGDVLMVDAFHFFGAIDSQVTLTGSSVLNVRMGESRRMQFTVGSKYANVDGRMVELDAAPIFAKRLTRKIIYVPLLSVSSIADYGAVWDEKGKTLLIEPQVKALDFGGGGESFNLNLTFSQAVEPERINLASDGNAVTIELRDVLRAKDLPDTVAPELSGIKSVKFSRPEARKLLVTVLLDRPRGFRTASLGEGRTLSVFFSPSIDRVITEKGNGWVKLQLRSDHPLTFESSRADAPHRMIFDFRGTLLLADNELDMAGGAVTGANLSQYSLDPTVTRLVVSSTEKINCKTFFVDGGKRVSLVFSWAAGKVVKRPKKFKVLSGKVIVIDAGHGGKDPGTISYSGLFEKKATLPLALRIADVLERAGATVLLTKERDKTLSMQAVTRFANTNKADIFIAVHYNSFVSKYTSGTETYYFTPQSYSLARAVHRNLVASIRRKNRGIKRVMYYTIHHTNMPAVLIEPGYISNPAEERLAFSPLFQEKVANGVLKGVVRYFEMKGK